MDWLDRIHQKFTTQKPEPIKLEPAKEGDVCSDPECGGTIRWKRLELIDESALRCEVCNKEPRR